MSHDEVFQRKVVVRELKVAHAEGLAAVEAVLARARAAFAASGQQQVLDELKRQERGVLAACGNLIAALAAEGKMNAKDVARAIKVFNIDPEKANPIGV